VGPARTCSPSSARSVYIEIALTRGGPHVTARAGSARSDGLRYILDGPNPLFTQDRGRSWGGPYLIEPNNTTPTSLPNAYATVAIGRTGRIYAIYNINSDNVTCPGSNVSAFGKPCHRARNDELGHFALRCSDTGGRSWSQQRYPVPYRNTAIDRNNTWGGKVQIMWNVDQVGLGRIVALHHRSSTSHDQIH
jgi:hypothetical protein